MQQSTNISIIFWKSSLKLSKKLRRVFSARMVLHFLVFQRTSSLLEKRKKNNNSKKNNEKIFQSYENALGSKIVKPGKYEALRKALKKWLLILRNENLPVNGSMFQEKAFQFANELDIEGFQASEWWLEKF